MTLDGHVLVTGKDGVLVGRTPADATALLDQAFTNERVVVHVHGGLVDEAAGRRIAESLLPVYEGAGAFPVFLVWQSGLLEILRRNVLQISREQFFERLLRRVLGWSVGKVRQAEEGTRAGAPPLPDQGELDRELGARLRESDPARGSEPFGLEQPDLETAALLSPGDEELFLAQVTGDTALQQQLQGIAASRGLEPDGARGAAAAAATSSLIDDDAFAEITEGEEGTRAVVSTLLLAKKALQVLRAVLARYRNGTDSGIYPTVVEELLRAFYLGNAGGAVWSAMKQETLDAFHPGAADRAGGIILDRAGAALADRRTRVTLVGHSTGAVLLDNFLTAAVRRRDGTTTWPASGQVQVVHLAPACTTEHFALALDDAERLVGRYRLFTMTDASERADRLAGSVYPRSLLYLVSGLLERDRDKPAVVPVLGLSRYLAATALLDTPLGRTARLSRVGSFLGTQDRLILSPTADGAAAGARSGAIRHGDFDDDRLVRESLAELIGTW